MSRWGAPKRTRADKERDLLMFVSSATDEMLARSTGEVLAGRYGVDVRFAEYHLRIALQRRDGGNGVGIGGAGVGA